ncbi:MAG: type II toxin-antitoxin system RelE/ParE family toxin [candidate division NC10 bacterium]
MSRDTRRISWIKAARRDFEDFPQGAQDEVMDALTVAAEGRKADIAKPLKDFGSGMFEVALAWRGNAYRAVYAVQIAEDVWVVHAFQKKSKTGIKTPKPELDLIRQRLQRLKEMLK